MLRIRRLREFGTLFPSWNNLRSPTRLNEDARTIFVL
jgi:hypothetical protein